jgi:nickel-type superoxide dismutase maturation protease
VEGNRRPGEDPPQRAPLLKLFRSVASLAAVGAGLAVGRAARRWLDVVEVRGDSMAPALLPGDRLLVECRTYALRRPLSGEVVLADDPRRPDRELIKRIGTIDEAANTVELLGDAVADSTDSRVFGTLPLDSIRWRAAFRYWPRERIGRI